VGGIEERRAAQVQQASELMMQETGLNTDIENKIQVNTEKEIKSRLHSLLSMMPPLDQRRVSR
jgi:hypothetical protein